MKKSFSIDWNKLERTLGGLKFAVIIILLFSLAMIVGTFLESYYGTDFANRTVYKTSYFMLIQFGMLLSIVFAAFLRLPPKKRLYGFYVIHAGLIIIGIGSVITYIAGIDGSMLLAPNEPTRTVILSKDVFKMTYPEEGKQVTKELPYTAFDTELDYTYNNISVKEYIPFAEGKFVWASPINKYPAEQAVHTSKYFFKNPFASETLTLTLHPEASNEFIATQSMGPLTFHYMPEKLVICFAQDNNSGLFVWDTTTQECYTPESKGIKINETSANNRFIVIKNDKELLTFFPDFSPYPVDLNFQVNQKSTMRVFSKKQFEEKPNLFLFGKRTAFYNKNTQKWEYHDFKDTTTPVDLPWMSAEITLLEHKDDLVPFNLPEAVIPIQKNGQLIHGDLRAVRIEILGREYWISNYAPLSLIIGGQKVIMEVTKESINLPFELALTNFKMDTDPGTNNPASYESFVKLFDNGQTSNHHIFMNNPLKHAGFTFYQASYSQDSGGNYSSTLAVNVDQGRFLKYLGSLMLVFGGIWHYMLNRKKSKGANA